MPSVSSSKARSKKAAPPGLEQAAAALLQSSGGRRVQLKFREEEGTALLRTVVFSTGRKLLALRVAHPSRAPALKMEAWALKYLEGAGIAPAFIATSEGTADLPQPHQLVGHGTPAFKGPLSTEDLEDVGALVGRLHAEADVSLRMRAPRAGSTTLMSAFQRLSDEAKAYLARRERDGLPQDLFTLSLSDMMRALRKYVVASEHHFLPPPARMLCHGALAMDRVRAGEGGRLWLVGLEHAHAGDGAQDLAHLIEQAALTEGQVMALLAGYRRELPRQDGHAIQRMCAWRVLFRLQRAVESLRELQALTDVMDTGLGTSAPMLEGELGRAQEHLQLAMNGLMDFTGPSRPVSRAEVAGMGALIATEELYLRGDNPVVGVEGPSYTGKTPLAQDVATRLRVPWVSLAAVLRAAAWATGAPQGLSPGDLADMLRRLDVVMDGLQVRLMWDGKDALTEVRSQEELIRLPPSMMEEAPVREAVRELVARVAVRGAVVEGSRVADLLPPGAFSVVLWATPEVRAARRQAHLETLPPDVAETRSQIPLADGGDDLPDILPGQILIDGSHLSVSQQVRTILRAMVPYAAGDEPTLSGRPVLFA